MPWVKGTVHPVKRFLNDPLAFMSENLVLIGYHARTPDELATLLRNRAQHGTKVWQRGYGTSIEHVTLQSHPTAVAMRHGTQVPLYNLMPAKSGSGDAFDTYWCPYQQQEDWSITVKDRADFMFTDTMDGCSFAVGNAAPDGSRMVMHSNRGGNQSAQDAAIQSKMTNIQTTLHPDKYRYEYGVGHLKSTTFGVRSGGQWTFYAQIYTVADTPGKYYFRGVKQFL